MKRHKTVKVVLVTILVFMLLSWIFKAAYFQGQYYPQARIQMGIFDLFSYPTTALSYFGYIALYVLVVGGFYGILNKIPAYRVLLDRMAKAFKKKGKLVLSIIMILLAVITSICGLQLGLVMFFPFLIGLILLMGYDKLVAALTVVGSTMIGIMGTTFGYENTKILVDTLNVKLTNNIVAKIVILVLGLALLIFYVMRYISKSGKSKKYAAKLEDFIGESTEVKTKGKGKKPTVWPLIVVFSLMFIIMILAFIPWVNAFNITAFDSATSAVTTFKIFKFPLFGKLLGNINAFGSWGLTELMAMMLIFAGLLMVIYKVKFSEGMQAFITGAKRALEPAVLVILIYTCLVIVTYHPYQLAIYKTLLGLFKGFNAFTTSLVAILASLFNADPAYVCQSVIPYMASIISKGSYPMIALIFQSMYGLTMLVAPTSLILMGVLSYLGISYKEWFKNIWKLLLGLLILLIIVFIVLILV